jgi:hypothetical protein
MYAELIYFEGAHFAHIARYYEHMRYQHRMTALRHYTQRAPAISKSTARHLAAAVPPASLSLAACQLPL